MSNDPDMGWLSSQTFKGGVRVDRVDLPEGVLTLSILPGADVDRVFMVCVRLPGEAGVLQRDAEGRPTQVKMKMKALFSERADPKPLPPLGLGE